MVEWLTIQGANLSQLNKDKRGLISYAHKYKSILTFLKMQGAISKSSRVGQKRELKNISKYEDEWIKKPKIDEDGY